MKSMRTRLAAALVATFSAFALVVGVAVPAQAASTIVTGELNCTGSTVYYNTTRYTSGSATIQFSLSNSAGSTYGGWSTSLGVYIVAENSYKGLKSMSLPSFPNAVLSGTYWLANTAFKMYGKMPVSDGPCDNVFAGTLYF